MIRTEGAEPFPRLEAIQRIEESIQKQGREEMLKNDRSKGKEQVILILGGARSGKSGYAQKMAEAFEGKRLLVATAQALDDEMAKRIENHKKRRGDTWETREEPVKIPDLISDSQDGYAVILIDCLTLWVSNLLMASGDDVERVEDGVERLVDCLATIRTTVVLVSNEVGLGIVPESRLARSFRDLAGVLNRRVAGIADRVIFMVAGIPWVLKG
jgi:adenosylcobinamide kinase/adenosylcobinamide-phosphate guanylyltransferase